MARKRFSIVKVGVATGYQADMVVTRGDKKYVVELRVAREARRPELPALLADAITRARAGAAAHGARPLGVVGAPSLSRAWRQELAAYAERFFPGEAWGLVDGAGGLVLLAPGLEALSSEPEPPRGDASMKVVARPDPFSDLGQWMAKVLLAPDLPERYLRAPRARAAGPKVLAEIAGVSLPTASRYASRLRELGFLAEGPAGLRLIRREALLAEWRQASRTLAQDLGCRWLIPESDSPRQLRRALQGRGAGPRLALGLFAACEQLGLGFVRGAPVHLHVEAASAELLETLGLAPVAPGERVDVFLRVPRFPEAIFRGAVDVEGVPTADVIQCWLDVSGHPVRGTEQAEQLYQRVLRKHLMGGDEA